MRQGLVTLILVSCILLLTGAAFADSEREVLVLKQRLAAKDLEIARLENALSITGNQLAVFKQSKARQDMAKAEAALDAFDRVAAEEMKKAKEAGEVAKEAEAK